MASDMDTLTPQKIDLYFNVSLFFKCAFAVSEIIAGIVVYAALSFKEAVSYLITHSRLLDAVRLILSGELKEDPHDLGVNFVVHLAQGFALSDMHFIALYLLSHGLVKIWLIIGLFKRKLPYYPAAMVVFGLFIMYQMYRFTYTHSSMLLFLTAVDLVVIWLTWKEYKNLKLHLI